MSKILKLLVVVIVLVPILGFGFFVYHVRRFAHLEERAKRVITAAELQAWATNVLAEFPTYSPAQVRQLRTNFPAKLSPVCRGIGGCWVTVFEREETISDSTSVPRRYPACVMIIWSIKPSGDAVLEIGPTNYVSLWPQAHAWAPGVYFHSR